MFFLKSRIIAYTVAIVLVVAITACCKEAAFVETPGQSNCVLQYSKNPNDTAKSLSFQLWQHIPKEIIQPGSNYTWLAKSDPAGGVCDSAAFIALLDSNSTSVFPKVSLFVPNSFSPNGDGNNDTFAPGITGNTYRYRLQVIDRWGRTVFDSTNPNLGWDGTYQGAPVATATYVFLINIDFFAESPNMFYRYKNNGIVSLIR